MQRRKEIMRRTTYSLLLSLCTYFALPSTSQKAFTDNIIMKKELKCTATVVNTGNQLTVGVFHYLENTCIYVEREHSATINATKFAYLAALQKISQCNVIGFLPTYDFRLVKKVLSTTHNLVEEYNNVQVANGETLLRKMTSADIPVDCFMETNIYVASLTKLTGHLTNKQIAIITPGGKCDSQLSNALEKSIRIELARKNLVSFNVKIYSLRKNQQITPIIDILKSIQSDKTMTRQRTFILLTTPEITALFFETSFILGLNTLNDMWIVKHATYNVKHLPTKVMTFSHLEYQEFVPITKQDISISNDLLTSGEFIEICPSTMGVKETHDRIKKYSGFDGVVPTVEIRIRWNYSWIKMFDIQKNQNDAISTVSYLSDFSFFHTPGLYQNKVVKIVSVVEGPFLFTSDYLYNANETLCENDAMLCRESTDDNGKTVWKSTCCYGYTVSLIYELVYLLGFQVDLYIVKDGKYGGFNATTGELNGMIGDVFTKKADLAIAGLTISSERLKHVDFTIPFMRAEIGIATLKRRTSPKYINGDFVNNLGPYMTFVIGGVFISGYLAILCIDNLVLYYERKINKIFRRFYRTHSYDWQECFTYISGLLFQRELGGINPSTSAGRTTSLFFAFAMVSLTTLYTASLTADRVIDSETQEFFGLKDKRMQNPTPEFKFATSSDTSIEEFFKNAPSEELNRMYRFMKSYNVKNLHEGINKVLDGTLQAYLNEYPFLKYYIAKESRCTLEIYENPVVQSSYGIALPKQSYLNDPLSAAILILAEEGVLLKLQQKWLTNSCDNQQDFLTSQQFSLYFFSTPLLLLGLVMIFCWMLILLEILVKKLLSRKSRGAAINGRLTCYWKQVKIDTESVIVRYR